MRVLELFVVFLSLISIPFGFLLLIADLVAVAHIFSTSTTSRSLYRFMYRITFAGVVLANVLMILAGHGLWQEAMTRDALARDRIQQLNVISPVALLLFLSAPWLRRWRTRERQTSH